MRQSQTPAGKVQVGQQEELCHRKGDQVLEWIAQAGGRLTISGGVREKIECDT